jgi:catecholate siderophore receptor
MKKIKSRKFSASRYSAAFATAAVIAVPMIARADDLGDEHGKHKKHDMVIVKGEKKKKASTQKRTEPLLNTPQTVTIIDAKTLEEQGATSLVDALKNTPGITMQLGENGNTSAGDTFQMRGFAAQSSVYLDGIRDLGAVSRDVFNIQQVEVAKGATGAENGRGSSAGYINLVSKRAHLNLRSNVTATAYSQGGARGEADLSKDIGETAAVRLNVFVQDVDVAGRDYINNSGYGIAPAFVIGQGTSTRLHIFGQYVHQENVPDGGIPSIGYDGFYNANAAIKAAAKVNSKNYYGSSSDLEETDALMGTIQFEQDLSPVSRITNTTRYGNSKMFRVLTGIMTITAVDANDPSTWTISRLRQGVDQENTIFANQTNFTTSFETGELKHDFVAGTEVLYEQQKTKTLGTTAYPVVGQAGVSIGTITAANLYNPNANDVLPKPVYTGASADGNTKTLGLYAFDTIELNKNWLFNIGLRSDIYKTETTSVTVATSTTTSQIIGQKLASVIEDEDTLFSWNIGALYKPRENGSVYLAYSTSQTPPGGTNFQLSTTASSTSNPNIDPQETENIEFGTKWDIFRNHLSLAAAYYNTTHKNELTLLDSVTNAYGAFGERTVKGFEFSIVSIHEVFFLVDGN